MIEVTVQRELPVTADKAWALVSDFGDISWAPGMNKVEVTGEGPGMVRAIHMPGGNPPIEERLEVLDKDQRLMEYIIPGGIPMPVTDYHASARGVALGGDSCRLDWSFRAKEVGVSAQDAQAIVAGFYGQMLDWIAAELQRR